MVRYKNIVISDDNMDEELEKLWLLYKDFPYFEYLDFVYELSDAFVEYNTKKYTEWYADIHNEAYSATCSGQLAVAFANGFIVFAFADYT